MPDQLSRSQGTQPPPAQALPQRLSCGTTPAFVAPAHHHDIAAATPPQPYLESTRQRNPRHTGPVNVLPRQHSSDESDGTDPSDPKKWFDRSNEHPGQSFGPRSMDIDPPFFQKETDSSSGAEKDRIMFPFSLRHFEPPPAHLTQALTTSSAEDYRSVIDDLTIEIKRLKEELRRYKENVPESLRKDALFEVRMYGLNRHKKRELENTLREFAASIEGSAGDLSRRRKVPGPANRLLPSSGSGSKHGTPSSSHSRPLDSAYASMSTTGTGNSNLNMPGGLAPHASLPDRAKSAEQKVQSYLEDIPEGLFPRHVAMTENERKKLIVRRLEKLFTGKTGGKNSRRVLVPGSEPPGQQSTMSLPLSIAELTQPSREARMLLSPGDGTVKKMSPGDNVLASMSGRGQVESGGAGAGINYRYDNGGGNDCGNTSWSGNGNSSGRSSGRENLTSPQSASLTEQQRPTRPHDLDPDRIQLPSENMDYIRHLGLVGPPNLSDSKFNAEDVPVDADGWIYLNLLCNMAQLHMFNVTLGFIRKAVSEKSTKFQLSPDGQKIRWRGGTDGTKFISDSSDCNSQRSGSTNGGGSATRPRRKKQKIRHSRDGLAVSTPSKNRQQPSRTGLSISNPSDTFHYKPLFTHRSPSIEQDSDDASSIGSLDRGINSNRNSNSRRDYSSRGFSQHRQRRAGGAIVFYNGTPFVTDLSRDNGDKSTFTGEASPTGKLQDRRELRPEVQRTQPVFAMQTRSLKKTGPYHDHEPTNVSQDGPGSRQDGSDWDLDSDVDMFPWSEDRQKPQNPRLYEMEAAGLGGVIPEDHFTVHVTTRRPIRRLDANGGSGNKKTRSSQQVKSEETTDSLSCTARMSMTSHAPRLQPASHNSSHPIKIGYLPGKVRKLEPVTLPPPATFLPPFSSDSDEDMSDSDISDERDESSDLVRLQGVDDREELMSKLANPRLSYNTYAEDSESNSADEENEVDPEAKRAYDASGSSGKHLPLRRMGGSPAIAGDEMESGYSRVKRRTQA